MEEITIGRANTRELTVGMALLAPIARHDTLAIIARDARGDIAGAGGLGWQSWGNPPGFPAWIEVLPDRRRRGVGRRLAEALREAAIGESPALWAARPLAIGAPAAVFAEAVGFSPVAKHLFFRANARTFLTRMEEIAGRLCRRERLAHTLVPSRISPSDVDLVCDLIGSHVRGASPRLRGDLAQSFEMEPHAAPVDVTRSMVLRAEGTVIGALLTKRLPDGDNSQIVVRVVAPGFRGGPANVALLLETTRVLIEDNCRSFDFDCADDVRDTVGLARRGEAECIRVDGLYRQAIATLD